MSYVWFRKAHQAAALGKGARAVGMAQSAQRIPQAGPLVKAVAIQLEAQGHALEGDYDTAMQRFDDARSLMSETGNGDPWYIGYCDAGYIDIKRSLSLIELRKPRRALDDLTKQIAALPTEYRGDQAVYLAHLAFGQALAGELDMSVETAGRSAKIAEDTRSARVISALRKTEDAMSQWGDGPQLQALRAVSASLVG